MDLGPVGRGDEVAAKGEEVDIGRHDLGDLDGDGLVLGGSAGDQLHEPGLQSLVESVLVNLVLVGMGCRDGLVVGVAEAVLLPEPGQPDVGHLLQGLRRFTTPSSL